MPILSNVGGPRGEHVASVVRALRESRGMSKTELGRRLAELGRPMSLDVITKLERGRRTIDVDDLVALAVALEVTPNRLLLPGTARVDAQVPITDEVTLRERAAWDWAQGRRPAIYDAELDGMGAATDRLRQWFDGNALPRELKLGQESAPVVAVRELAERLALYLAKPDDDRRRDSVISGRNAVHALIDDALKHPRVEGSRHG